MKKKVASVVCGIGIIVMTIVLIVDVKKTAINFQLNTQTSMGLADAVQLTAIMDGSVICILALVLVFLNILGKKNK